MMLKGQAYAQCQNGIHDAAAGLYVLLMTLPSVCKSVIISRSNCMPCCVFNPMIEWVLHVRSLLIDALAPCRDVLSSKEAVKIARDAFQKQRSPEDIAALLTERAYRKYSSDNVAVVVVDLGGPPEGWKASKPKGGLRGLFN